MRTVNEFQDLYGMKEQHWAKSRAGTAARRGLPKIMKELYAFTLNREKLWALPQVPQQEKGRGEKINTDSHTTGAQAV